MINVSDYIDAVNSRTFKNDELYPILKESSNLIQFESGQNAIVFRLVNNISKDELALKLYYDSSSLDSEKLTSISKYISNLKSKFFVSFYYENEYIYVDNDSLIEQQKVQPAVILEWVQGQTLGRLIRVCCLKNDKLVLKILTEKFKELSLFIIDSNFGHGDLKHDNIIVDAEMNMKLIDYDGMYIPDFKGQKSGELGTPSFQHPKRTSDDFNEKIDDFSILTMYVSLLVFERYPELYEKYEDQQNLFFRQEDYEHPEQSEIFQFLDKDKDLAKWSYLIKKSLQNEHIYIPELKNYLNNEFPKPQIKVSHTPENVLSGQEIEIRWETEYVDEIWFNNKNVGLTGTLKIDAHSNSSYRFKLKNFFEDVEYKYEINTLPRISIIQFKAQQQKIEYGSQTILIWEVENAQSIELHWLGEMEVVSNKGEKVISPIEHTTYKLIITALDGITKEEKELTVQVFKRVEIYSFTSNLYYVPETLPIQLSWIVENASNIVVEDNFGTQTDVTHLTSLEIFPRKNTRYYKIIASDPLRNTIEKKIDIAITELPTPILNLPTIKIPTLDLSLGENVLDNITLEYAFEQTKKEHKTFNPFRKLIDFLYDK